MIPTDEIPAEEQWHHYHSIKDTFPLPRFLKHGKLFLVARGKAILESLLNLQKTPFQNAQAFTEYVYKNFNYEQGVTSVETEIEEIWQLKAGVCQDFAHMLLVLLRLFKYTRPVCKRLYLPQG